MTLIDDIGPSDKVPNASNIKGFCWWNKAFSGRGVFGFGLLLVIISAWLTITYSMGISYNPAIIIFTSMRIRRLPLCSFPLLKDAPEYRISGYIPATGNWTINGSLIQFQPKICRFKYGNEWPADAVRRCLSVKRFKNIFIIGDSNGAYYNAALIKFLTRRKDYKCEVLQHETSARHKIDPLFFVTDKTNFSEIRVADRRCSFCESSRMRCSQQQAGGGGSNYTSYVNVTYISMQRTYDALLTSSLSNTSQEFIFSEYLKGSGNVPDLVMIFGPSHDHEYLSLIEYRKAVHRFLDVMDQHLPPFTRVVWLSKPSFYPPRQPANWRYRIFDNHTTNEYMDITNRMLFEEIRERFNEKGRPLAFFDTYDLMNPIQSVINMDGIHSYPVWYELFISYVFQTLCADLFK